MFKQSKSKTSVIYIYHSLFCMSKISRSKKWSDSQQSMMMST
jgi:hypothetical protein